MEKIVSYYTDFEQTILVKQTTITCSKSVFHMNLDTNFLHNPLDRLQNIFHFLNKFKLIQGREALNPFEFVLKMNIFWRRSLDPVFHSFIFFLLSTTFCTEFS